jgi:hypothetical protein
MGRAISRMPSVADKAYSSRAIRRTLRRRGIRAVIRRGPTRRPTAYGAAGPAADRQPSTASSTKPAT